MGAGEIENKKGGKDQEGASREQNVAKNGNWRERLEKALSVIQAKEQRSEKAKKGEAGKEGNLRGGGSHLRVDVMEVKQASEQEKEVSMSLKVLDQNVLKEIKKEKDRERAKNGERWKRIMRLNQREM